MLLSEQNKILKECEEKIENSKGHKTRYDIT